MSTHYLFDAHTAPIGDSKLREVSFQAGTAAVINITGAFPVQVDDHVQLDNSILTLSDVLTEKYAGLLATYPGFTRITFDDLLDAANVDTSGPSSTTNMQTGERYAMNLAPGGVLQSTAVALTGPDPTEAIVVWETFINDGTSHTTRDERGRVLYEQKNDTGATASVSFDGGANFNSVTSGGLLSIPLAQRGLSFIIRLTNALGFETVYPASWAVIY